jgi:hypothetical protein
VPQFGGLPKSNLASKFINFGTNDFLGGKHKCHNTIKRKHAHNSLNAHYVAPRTNLTLHTLSSLHSVCKIEILL